MERIHGVIEALQKNLECPICLEVSKNPVYTKCGHKFCNHCLVKTLNNKRSVPCPLCKKPVTLRSLQPLSEWSRFISSADALHQAYFQDTASLMSGDAPQPSISAAAPPSQPTPKNSTLREEEVRLLKEPETPVSPLPFTHEMMAPESPQPDSPTAEELKTDEQEAMCPGTPFTTYLLWLL